MKQPSKTFCERGQVLVDRHFMELTANNVWFEPRTGLLSVEISSEICSVVESIDFGQIPPEDFESTAPIVKFDVGQSGSIVVCHHHDGEETWLPIDMWLPGDFTPPLSPAEATIG